jgi:hypothetical protein
MTFYRDGIICFKHGLGKEPWVLDDGGGGIFKSF